MNFDWSIYWNVAVIWYYLGCFRSDLVSEVGVIYFGLSACRWSHSYSDSDFIGNIDFFQVRRAQPPGSDLESAGSFVITG